MKLTPVRLLVFVLSFAGAGCGDSFPKLIQSEMSLVNEMADHLLKIVDESSAAHFNDNYSEKLKAAWDEVQKRKDLYMKSSELTDSSGFVTMIQQVAPIDQPRFLGIDVDEIDRRLEKLRREIGNDEGRRDIAQKIDKLRRFLIEYTFEFRPRFVIEANSLRSRLNFQQRRLDVLIARLQRNCPNLIKARDAPRSIFGSAKVGLATVLLP